MIYSFIDKIIYLQFYYHLKTNNNMFKFSFPLKIIEMLGINIKKNIIFIKIYLNILNNE